MVAVYWHELCFIVLNPSSKKSANLPSIQYLQQISKRAVILEQQVAIDLLTRCSEEGYYIPNILYMYGKSKQPKLFHKSRQSRRIQINHYQGPMGKYRLPDRKHRCRMGCKRSMVSHWKAVFIPMWFRLLSGNWMKIITSQVT